MFYDEVVELRYVDCLGSDRRGDSLEMIIPNEKNIYASNFHTQDSSAYNTPSQHFNVVFCLGDANYVKTLHGLYTTNKELADIGKVVDTLVPEVNMDLTAPQNLPPVDSLDTLLKAREEENIKDREK